MDLIKKIVLEYQYLIYIALGAWTIAIFFILMFLSIMKQPIICPICNGHIKPDDFTAHYYEGHSQDERNGFSRKMAEEKQAHSEACTGFGNGFTDEISASSLENIWLP